MTAHGRSARRLLPLLLGLLGVAPLLAGAAHADELTQMLRGGPVVRIETNSAGGFQKGTAVADVNAPADRVWQVLTDYEAYDKFLPLVEEADVERQAGHTLIDFELDTPFVSTSYTNKYTERPEERTLIVDNVKGDLKGTSFTWKVVPRGEGCRIYLTGAVKNYSAMLQRFEDDQQTITIGVNVGTLMQSIKAIKQRAEQLERARPGGGSR